MSKKKKFTLLCFALDIVLMLTIFLPLYQIPATETKAVTLGPIWEYMAILQTNHFVFTCIGLAIAIICYIFSMFRLIASYKAKEDDGDKEDKYFVFGQFVYAVPMAIYALIGITWHAYVLGFIGLAGALASLGAIYYHYSKLSAV